MPDDTEAAALRA
jgi:hypothetical protein